MAGSEGKIVDDIRSPDWVRQREEGRPIMAMSKYSTIKPPLLLRLFSNWALSFDEPARGSLRVATGVHCEIPALDVSLIEASKGALVAGRNHG